MTKEEKAIEYCGCNQPICRKGFETKDKQNCTCARKKNYLDGLADGKPKWHEIESHVTPSREIEKQYMPKTGEKVLLKYHFYNDEEIHYSDGYYDNYDFEFHIPNNTTGRVICVIAWCELF